MKSCTIDGCARALHAKGLCNLHRQRLSRHGDARTMLIQEKGQGCRTRKGYWMLTVNGRKVFRHVVVAEKALGRVLPDEAEVHHVDENKGNDANCNLVICENHAYHILLHQRKRALTACGHAHYRKCAHCKLYCDPSVMREYSGTYAHVACKRQYNARAREQEKGLL